MKAVNQYKETESEEARALLAKKIQKRFIGVRSSSPINVSGAVVGEYILTCDKIDELWQQIEKGSRDKTIFDAAYSQTLEILKYDSFPRFVKWLKIKYQF